MTVRMTVFSTHKFISRQWYHIIPVSSLLVILASSLILTCHSQIKLTPCLSLVIFISEMAVVFAISFLFLQLQRLPIHSSPANLIIVIHSTMAFRKQTWTKYSAYQNTLARVVTNTSKFKHITPILKQITLVSNQTMHCVFLHIKHFKFSNLPIFTIVFLFLLTLCLQDHLIHRFCPSHMSGHIWVKGPFLSLLQDSIWNSLPPDTRNSLSVSTFRSKLKTDLFKLAFPLEFSPILSSDCLPGFDSCFSFTFLLLALSNDTWC